MDNDKDMDNDKTIDNDKVMNKVNIYDNIVNKYASLAPTDDAENYDLYDGVITMALEDKNHDKSYKNRNIAITGIYGAGKSSIIKTYFSKHKEYHSITISLGKFKNNSLWSNDIMDQDIENSLLQQIIYTVRPDKLPFSRINRADVDVEENDIFAVLLSCSISLIIFCFKIKSIVKLIKKTLPFEYLGSIVIFMLLFFLLLSFLLFVLLRKVKLYSYIKKIHFKENEVELDENTNSVLGKSIDELIHFFMMTDYNVVILEDIDRLSQSIDLFTKLKEVNFILNNSVNDKCIRFIYEINDSIFDSSEYRSKFFDSIIPIVSYTTNVVSNVLLKEKFEKIIDSKEIISDEDFIYVGSYCDNARVVSDICNEFSIYYGLNMKYVINARIKVLFYLVSYKVLFPKRFDNFLNNKGALAFIVSDDYRKFLLEKYVEDRTKFYDDEIKKINESIPDLDNPNLVDEYENNKLKLQDLSYYDINSSFKEKFDNGFMNEKHFFRYMFNGLEDDNGYSFNELNPFEHYLIDNDYIDNRSVIYFTVQNGSLEEIEDRLLLSDLIRGSSFEFKTPIHNPDAFIGYFHKNLLKFDNFCLMDIYKQIVDIEKYPGYLDVVFDNLSVIKLQNIMKMNIPEIYNDLTLTKIWNFLELRNDLENDLIGYYIVKTIQYSQFYNLNGLYLFDVVKNFPKIDSIFNKFYDEVKENLKKYNFRFNQPSFDIKNNKFLLYVYDNEMYGSNVALFNSILKSFNNKIDDASLLQSYYDIANAKVIRFIHENIKSIIDYIYNSKIDQNDSSKVYKNVILLLDNEYANKLLSLESKTITSIKNLEKFFPLIDKNSKYTFNIKNLYLIFNYNKKNNLDYFVSHEMIENINLNYQKLLNRRMASKYSEFFEYLITNTDISYDAFIGISDYYFKNTKNRCDSFNSNLSEEKIKYLIMNNRLYTSNFDDILYFYNSSRYTRDISKKYLENSFDYFLDKKPNLNTTILIDIMDFDSINFEDSIAFISQYPELLDDDLYKIVFKKLYSNKDTLVKIDKDILINSMLSYGNVKGSLKDISKLILRYKEKLSYRDVCKILGVDSDFRKLNHMKNGNLNKKTLHLRKTNYEEDFINYLCKLSDGELSFSGYIDHNRIYSIKYNCSL